MGKPFTKFIIKPYEGQWRVWNRKLKRWWGNPYKDIPHHLLAELNGEKRPEEIERFLKGLRPL